MTANPCTVVFEHAIAATRGAREYQEDSAAVWPDDAPGFARLRDQVAPPAGTRVAVLADGMGGHTGGALASRMVCEEFLSAMAAAEGALAERLDAALVAANAALAAKVAERPSLAGMGSTMIGTTFGPEGVSWISVGDSPLFLVRRGEIALLNEDHSLAPELDRLVAEGRMTADEARRDSRRHMLRSAVTGEEIDLVDVSRRPLALQSGDFVILASDGIATLETAEIGRIVQAYARDDAAAVAKALIRAIDALREPYQDNATVVVVRTV